MRVFVPMADTLSRRYKLRQARRVKTALFRANEKINETVALVNVVIISGKIFAYPYSVKMYVEFFLLDQIAEKFAHRRQIGITFFVKVFKKFRKIMVEI